MDQKAEESPENPEENQPPTVSVMADTEEIQVSFPCEVSGEDPENPTSQDQDEEEKKDTRKSRPSTLKSWWQTIVIALLTVLFCAMTGIVFVQMSENRSLLGEVFTLWNITKQLQKENTELKKMLNSTFENSGLVEEERRNLTQHLNESLHIITTERAENKRLNQLLINEQQTSIQLQAQSQKQRTVLLSSHVSFIWKFCNNSTLECSRCIPGWVEHASRCFFLSSVKEKWEDARRVCKEMGGDLAIVNDAEDQAFLTNMTFQFAQAHPEQNFHSAWIGLQDMVKEGTHLWLNGKTVKWNVRYWRENEPNNAVPEWDIDQAGQDCVAIVAPDRIGGKDWLNSWDDIVCAGLRHYLCETMAFE